MSEPQNEFAVGDHVTCHLPGSWVDRLAGIVEQLDVANSPTTRGHLVRIPERGKTTILSPEDLKKAIKPPLLVTGLDLGQTADYSALVVVERTMQPDPDQASKMLPHFVARHIHRWVLGTPYPQIVSDVKGMFAEEPLKGSPLVIDSTGVGKPVVDMFRAAEISATIKPVTITGGESAGSGATAPKQNLVAAVQVPLQTRRLKIAEELPHAETLAKELEQFRCKVTASRNEVFEAWRERDHDDLVLSLALAVHYAARNSGEIVISQRDIPLPLKMPERSTR